MGFIICRRKIYDNSNKGWEEGEQNQTITNFFHHKKNDAIIIKGGL